MLTFAPPRPGARRTVAFVPPDCRHLTVTPVSVTRRGDVGDARRRRVVLERKGGRCLVAGLVGAGAADRSRGGIRPCVAHGRGARVDAGRCVRAGERDRNRMVVPAGLRRLPLRGPVTVGGVASYLTAKDAEPLTLPALSRHVPVAVPVAESGPEYVVDVHDARPDVLSVPWNDTRHRVRVPAVLVRCAIGCRAGDGGRRGVDVRTAGGTACSGCPRCSRRTSCSS